MSVGPSNSPITSATSTGIGNGSIVFSSNGNLGIGGGWRTKVSADTIVFTDTNGEEVSLIKVLESLNDIKKMLAIIEIDKVLNEKYPTLREAYDHYEAIKKLVEGD